MFFAGIEPTTNPNPWRFQFHPEVWLLIIGLIAAFVYTVRVLGPKVAPEGKIISRRQITTFTVMILLLWLASDWPMHDLAEEYLYSVHMVQHMVISYIVPPLALLATPEWLFRLLIGQGRTYKVVRFLTRPVVGVLVYNDDHAYSSDREPQCGWWTIALFIACPDRHHFVDVLGARVRTHSRMAHGRWRQDDLPLWHLIDSHHPCRLADIR